MRKQFHFWPAESGEGLDAWDVHRLVRLSHGLPVKRVALDSIWEVDTDYWSDAEAGPTVRRLLGHMRAVLDVDASYPIIQGYDGRVMDGMHRICRAILNQETMIDAVQFETHPEPDFRNCHHSDFPYC